MQRTALRAAANAQRPGMRPTDFHVWMSVSKTTTSLVVRLLAEGGKIDVEKPIESSIPALRNTDWAGTRVIDVLDMAFEYSRALETGTEDDSEVDVRRYDTVQES